MIRDLVLTLLVILTTVGACLATFLVVDYTFDQLEYWLQRRYERRRLARWEQFEKDLDRD